MKATAALLLAAAGAMFGGAQTTPAPTAAAPTGHVLFSGSTDANGQAHTAVGDTKLTAGVEAAQPVANDGEREAIRVTAIDLDVHLRPAASQLAARAQLTIRNDSNHPIAHIPLQLSSSLRWERLRLNGHEAHFTVATLNTDVDHTGQLREAAIELPTPLAAGASVSVDASYSGTIEQSARRLLAIGTPEALARHSDWDEISTSFTGLRGLGNVVWYPAASVPVILGDGARLFDEMGRHKQRLLGTTMRTRLTVEFPRGLAPTVAVLNGHAVPLRVVDASLSLDASSEVSSVATAEQDTVLGFQAPSLFVAQRKSHEAANTTVWTTVDHAVSGDLWLEAARVVHPLVTRWLGSRPHAELTLLDLPDAEDTPFESGALLATSLGDASPEQLNGILAHALSHATTNSLSAPPPAWLDEGVAHFVGTLWVERKRGREAALTALEAGRSSLALVEPESPGRGPGEPLTMPTEPAYYRTKAAYVLWMLRDMLGDEALAAALSGYDPAANSFQKLLEKASNRSSLNWFFADWVTADKGLPDLTIDGAFPTAAQAGNYLVAVAISNNGYAAAELPVTVRSATNSTTERVLVPAHDKVTQRLLVLGKPTEVQVNDGIVPEAQSTVHLLRFDDAPKPAPAGSSSSQPTAPIAQ